MSWIGWEHCRLGCFHFNVYGNVPATEHIAGYTVFFLQFSRVQATVTCFANFSKSASPTFNKSYLIPKKRSSIKCYIRLYFASCSCYIQVTKS